MKSRLQYVAALAALGMAAGAPVWAQAPADPPATAAPASRQLSVATTHLTKAVDVLRRMQADPALAGALRNARGVFVVPQYGGAALGVGASGGPGVLLTRRGEGWTDPAFYTMGSISIGAQAGVHGGAVAFVLNNEKALNSFMKNNKFALNANAGLTVVNWSKAASGSAGMGDISVWTDTEGLFGGLTIGVSDVHFDQKETAAYYGKRVAARDVIGGKVTNPHEDAFRQAVAVLNDTGTAATTGGSGTAGSTATGTGQPATGDAAATSGTATEPVKHPRRKNGQ